jgi:predicted RNA polymerase sigma factor
MATGPAAGLTLLEPFATSMAGYVYYHIASADMHRRLGADQAATAHYQRALQLATNDVQQAALNARIAEILANPG